MVLENFNFCKLMWFKEEIKPTQYSTYTIMQTEVYHECLPVVAPLVKFVSTQIVHVHAMLAMLVFK